MGLTVTSGMTVLLDTAPLIYFLEKHLRPLACGRATPCARLTPSCWLPPWSVAPIAW